MKKILIILLLFISYFANSQTIKKEYNPVYFHEWVKIKKYLNVADTISCDSLYICSTDTCIWISPYTINNIKPDSTLYATIWKVRQIIHDSAYSSGAHIRIGADKSINLGDAATSDATTINIDGSVADNDMFSIGTTNSFMLISGTSNSINLTQKTGSLSYAESIFDVSGSKLIGYSPSRNKAFEIHADTSQCAILRSAAPSDSVPLKFINNATTSAVIWAKGNELYFKNNYDTIRSLTELASGGGTIDTTKTPLIGHYGTQYDLSLKQNKLTNPVTTPNAGVSGFLAAYTGAGTIDSINAYWTGSRLGLGTTSPNSLFEMKYDNIGSTPTLASSLSLINTTAGVAGVQQSSPGLHLRSYGYASTPIESRTTDWLISGVASESTSNPVSYLYFYSSINNGAYASKFALANNGNLTLSGAVSGITNLNMTGSLGISLANSTSALTQTLILTAATAATALVPQRSGGGIAWTGYGWTGAASKNNTIGVHQVPTNAAVTSGNLIFVNATVDGVANTNELMRLRSDGTLIQSGNYRVIGENEIKLGGSVTSDADWVFSYKNTSNVIECYPRADLNTTWTLKNAAKTTTLLNANFTNKTVTIADTLKASIFKSSTAQFKMVSIYNKMSMKLDSTKFAFYYNTDSLFRIKKDTIYSHKVFKPINVWSTGGVNASYFQMIYGGMSTTIQTTASGLGITNNVGTAFPITMSAGGYGNIALKSGLTTTDVFTINRDFDANTNTVTGYLLPFVDNPTNTTGTIGGGILKAQVGTMKKIIDLNPRATYNHYSFGSYRDLADTTTLFRLRDSLTTVLKVDAKGYIHADNPHAVSQFMDSSIVIALTQDVWVQITGATKQTWPTTEFIGFTESGDTIIAGYTGDFNLAYEVNLLGVSSKDYEYRMLRKRGVTTTTIWSYKITSSGNAVLRSIRSYLEDVLPNDRYWIETRSTSVSPGNLTIYGGRMICTTIHLD